MHRGRNLIRIYIIVIILILNIVFLSLLLVNIKSQISDINSNNIENNYEKIEDRDDLYSNGSDNSKINNN